MKFVAIALALSASQASSETLDEKCAALGSFAETTMTVRQQDVPMSKMMTTIPAGSGNELMREIVKAAFEEPSWATDESKKRAIAKFRNDIESMCYKNG